MRFVDEYFRRERLTGHGLPSHVGDLQEIGRLNGVGLGLGEKRTDRAVPFSRSQLFRNILILRLRRAILVVVAGMAAGAAAARLSFCGGRRVAAASIRSAMLAIQHGMQPVAENSRAAIHQQNQARES